MIKFYFTENSISKLLKYHLCIPSKDVNAVSNYRKYNNINASKHLEPSMSGTIKKSKMNSEISGTIESVESNSKISCKGIIVLRIR